MWYGKQASPTSSTSTVDQQEILFDDTSQSIHHQANIYHQSPSSLHRTNSSNIAQQQQQQNLHNLNNLTPITTGNVVAVAPSTTGSGRGRQPGPGRGGAKRPRNTNSQYSRTNGTGGAPTTSAKSNPLTTGNNSKCSPPKKPKLYHLTQQLTPWKSLQHHFLKYTDIKYRPEKRMTMAELSNEATQRRHGWKVHHLVGQLTDLVQNEMQNREKVTSLLELFVDEGAKRINALASNCHKLPEQYAALLQSQRSYGKNEFNPELIITKLDDLLRGDIQRSNMFDDQLRDCRDLIVRITNEHRDRVSRISTKFNKRIQLP